MWEATSGLLYSGPETPPLERLPSGWNLRSMELTPFEPQALDIFSIVTDEQVKTCPLYSVVLHVRSLCFLLVLMRCGVSAYKLGLP